VSLLAAFGRFVFSPTTGIGRFLADAFIGQLTSVTRLVLAATTVATGLVLGRVVGNTLLASWGFGGRVVGVVICAATLLVLLWAVVLGRILLFFPFPTCRRGRCSTISDYAWDMGTLYGKRRWGTYSYTCRCGDRYERVGRTFVAIDPDGSRSVLRRLRGFRTWEAS
jgi:hypothetical protein